jgi:hypothetical protein
MSSRVARVLCLCCLLSTRVARAGNDDELLVGNHAAMLAGAVSSTIDDSSSTWYNPAGLGSVERDHVDVSSTVYTVRRYSTPRLISTRSGASDDGSVTEFVVAPTQIAFVRRIGQGLSLGIGYFVPHASNYVLRESLVDREGQPPSQWQIATANAETQHIGAAALGCAFGPSLRLGVSLLAGYAANVTSSAVFGAASPGGRAQASSSITLIGTTSRVSMQLGVGMQWDISPRFVLGVSIRSPELQLYSIFDGTYNASVASLADVNDPRLSTISDETQTKHGIDLLRAGRGGASLAYRYAAGTITAEVDYQPPLHRVRNSVDRKAVINGRLGFYRTLSRALAFGVGLFSDRSSAAQPYSFAEGSGDYYGGTLGLEVSNEHFLAPGERARSLVFKSVFAIRYAYTHGQFGRVVGDPTTISTEPFATDKGSIDIHEFGLYVGGGLQF